MPAEIKTDDQAIDAWIAWLRHNKGRAERTERAYRLAMERLKDFLAGKSILVAEASELELFCGLWLHKKNIVARARVPYVSAVRGFYAWARSNKLVQSDLVKDLVYPRTGRPLPRVITLANAERICAAPDLGSFKGIRDAAMLSLLVGCGLRVSGLVSLNESNLIVVENEGRPRMVLRVVEKGNKERMLPVPLEAEMMLRVYLEHEDMVRIDRTIHVGRHRQEDRVLFVSVRSTVVPPHEHRGERRRLTDKAVRDMVMTYGQALGIPVDQLHPHAMRHLFGTELAEDQVPDTSIQTLMGHADIKSTSIYTHLAMRRAMKLMDASAPLAKIRTPVSDLLKRMPK